MKQGIKITFILFVFSLNCFAQQRPQYTQYIFNNFLLNPAISGIENYTDVKIGHRQQWTGINDAPKTSFISINWKLGDDYLWRNALSLPDEGDNPMSRNYMQNYMSSPSHHGMGVIAVMDKAGALSRLDANINYAYHLQLSNQLNLSVGVAAGLSRIGLDVNQLLFENDNDAAISNTIISQVKPDLNMGIWLYGARFFVGASAQQLLPQKLKFTNNASINPGSQVVHFFLTTGYRFFVSEEVAATPSVMVKRISGVPTSIDTNLKLSFQDRFWVGGSYRKNDSFSALAGVNISKLINLTYSYDFVTSQLNRVSNGSHEIVLGLQLNNVYKVMSSQKMW